MRWRFLVHVISSPLPKYGTSVRGVPIFWWFNIWASLPDVTTIVPGTTECCQVFWVGFPGLWWGGYYCECTESDRVDSCQKPLALPKDTSARTINILWNHKIEFLDSVTMWLTSIFITLNTQSGYEWPLTVYSSDSIVFTFLSRFLGRSLEFVPISVCCLLIRSELSHIRNNL